MKLEHSDSPLPRSLDEWSNGRPDSERRALEEVWILAEHGRIRMTDADRRRKAVVWDTLQERMDEPEHESPSRSPLRLVRMQVIRWGAVAAVITVLFGIGYVFRTVTVTAPRGELAQVSLPDGSEVELNSESSITFRSRFFNTRKVRLEGEAYFEVSESGKRFIVETFNANTAVLGTRFNVRARPTEAKAATSVVVAVGRVHLSSKAENSEGVILTAGQQSHLASSAQRPTTPESVTLTRRLAWRTGGLAFSNQSFDAIFDEIGRRYNVEIAASDNILGEAFSYYVHEPESAELVIADLVAAVGLRYRKTSQGFEVFRP